MLRFFSLLVSLAIFGSVIPTASAWAQTANTVSYRGHVLLVVINPGGWGYSPDVGYSDEHVNYQNMVNTRQGAIVTSAGTAPTGTTSTAMPGTTATTGTTGTTTTTGGTTTTTGGTTAQAGGNGGLVGGGTTTTGGGGGGGGVNLAF